MIDCLKDNLFLEELLSKKVDTAEFFLLRKLKVTDALNWTRMHKNVERKIKTFASWSFKVFKNFLIERIRWVEVVIYSLYD
jgi:methionyl-tRNA formyltransferase